MRVLVTGLSTYWGGRLAQALERDPSVDAIVGIDRRPPKVALERTEYVEVADAHTLIQRVVEAAEIDTVVDTRLVVESGVTSPRRAHENNVVGTTNILAACGGPDSPVRRLVFRSSALFYGAHQDDPAFFTEDMRRGHEPRTQIERDVVEAEGLVDDFAATQGDRTKVCKLRFAPGIGPRLRTTLMGFARLPAIPSILGFDPRLQVVHEDDYVGALVHATLEDLEGTFNVGADGVLVLSEIAALLGRPLVPVLPPFGTALALGPLRRLGFNVPAEVVDVLRFGLALDNRSLKATGYRFRYTSREAIVELRRALKLERLTRSHGDTEPYRYERAVEDFLRYSPSVRGSTPREQGVAALPRGRAPS